MMIFFYRNEGFVKISGSMCTVVSWQDDEIKCTTESHEETGSYPVSVDVPNKGFANPVRTEKLPAS